MVHTKLQQSYMAMRGERTVSLDQAPVTRQRAEALLLQDDPDFDVRKPPSIFTFDIDQLSHMSSRTHLSSSSIQAPISAISRVSTVLRALAIFLPVTCHKSSMCQLHHFTKDLNLPYPEFRAQICNFSDSWKRMKETIIQSPISLVKAWDLSLMRKGRSSI